jgi:hypothetical protein
MTSIKKQIIVDADGKPVAVVVDIATFRAIEELLADVADVEIVEARLEEADLEWEEIKTAL